MTTLRDAAMQSKAWPFEEARRVLKRYEKKDPEKGYVLFETAYALACDVGAADGRLYEGEVAMLAEIRHQLNIPRLHAAAIELSAQVRHRVL